MTQLPCRWLTIICSSSFREMTSMENHTHVAYVPYKCQHKHAHIYIILMIYIIKHNIYVYIFKVSILFFSSFSVFFLTVMISYKFIILVYMVYSDWLLMIGILISSWLCYTVGHFYLPSISQFGVYCSSSACPLSVLFLCDP